MTLTREPLLDILIRIKFMPMLHLRLLESFAEYFVGVAWAGLNRPAFTKAAWAGPPVFRMLLFSGALSLP